MLCKMNKILLFFFVILLVLPLSFAAIYKQGDTIDIKISCTLNGFPCTSSALCNFTSEYPNGSYLVNNKEMNYISGGDFNYTLPSSSVTGEYPFKTSCSQEGNNETIKSSFEITQTGSELSTAQGIVYVVVLIASLFAFILALIGAIKIPFKNTRNDEGQIISVNDLKFVKIFLCFASYLLLMWIFFLVRNISLAFLELEATYYFFNLFYWFMLAFLFPIFVVFIIFSVIIFLESKKIKKALKRGLPVR